MSSDDITKWRLNKNMFASSNVPSPPPSKKQKTERMINQCEDINESISKCFEMDFEGNVESEQDNLNPPYIENVDSNLECSSNESSSDESTSDESSADEDISNANIGHEDTHLNVFENNEIFFQFDWKAIEGWNMKADVLKSAKGLVRTLVRNSFNPMNQILTHAYRPSNRNYKPKKKTLSKKKGKRQQRKKQSRKVEKSKDDAHETDSSEEPSDDEEDEDDTLTNIPKAYLRIVREYTFGRMGFNRPEFGINYEGDSSLLRDMHYDVKKRDEAFRKMRAAVIFWKRNSFQGVLSNVFKESRRLKEQFQ